MKIAQWQLIPQAASTKRVCAHGSNRRLVDLVLQGVLIAEMTMVMVLVLFWVMAWTVLAWLAFFADPPPTPASESGVSAVFSTLPEAVSSPFLSSL